MMFIGLLQMEIHFPGAQSLKDKRRCLRSIKDTLRRHNVSIAEVDGQDLWQRSRLGLVMVSNDRSLIEKVFCNSRGLVESHPGMELLDYEVQFL